ncbi:MAG: family 10 glycosylhydrolase, partial [candidate division KSB1 bacterium]|nr:family 10 glycosylhydrolase [candidate division KSB1 bacterium]
MKKFAIVFWIILLLWLHAGASGQIKELRGVWLTKTASTIFNSKASVAAAIDSLKKTGLNAVFPGIFENGFTLYPSEVMEVYTGNRVDYAYAERDLLAEIIAEAHRVGMEVHPWFEFGFAACYGSRGPILDHYPQWGGRRLSTGDALDDNSFYWLSQAHPEVQEFLISLAIEVVENYDVDGIMFDRIRYGLTKNSATGELIVSDFGYDDAHVERYRAENNGQDPPASPRDSNWMKWRSKILDEFVALLYDSVKAHNSNIMVTNTPVVYPYGYNLFLQNWPQWVRDNSIDFISPQVYRFNVNDYRRDLGTIVNQQVPAGYKRCYPGMLIREGSYNATPELAVNFIKENRNLGVEGGIFFFYEGLPSVAAALRQQVFQEPALQPFRPDDWRPEGIIIQEDSALVQRTGNWSRVIGTGASGYFSFDGQCLTAVGSSGAKIRYQ